jgi:hypothetical protein
MAQLLRDAPLTVVTLLPLRARDRSVDPEVGIDGFA